jgi:hypothetical protein
MSTEKNWKGPYMDACIRAEKAEADLAAAQQEIRRLQENELTWAESSNSFSEKYHEAEAELAAARQENVLLRQALRYWAPRGIEHNTAAIRAALDVAKKSK